MRRRLLYARLAEPSTWAGLAGLALAAGIGAEDWTVWSQGLAGIFAIVAIAVKEKGQE